MPDQNQKPLTDTHMNHRAFSRWENEGGAPAMGREAWPVIHHSPQKTGKVKNVRVLNYNNKDKNFDGTDKDFAVQESVDKKSGNIPTASEAGIASGNNMPVAAAKRAAPAPVKRPKKGDATVPASRNPDSIKYENPSLKSKPGGSLIVNPND